MTRGSSLLLRVGVRRVADHPLLVGQLVGEEQRVVPAEAGAGARGESGSAAFIVWSRMPGARRRAGRCGGASGGADYRAAQPLASMPAAARLQRRRNRRADLGRPADGRPRATRRIGQAPRVPCPGAPCPESPHASALPADPSPTVPPQPRGATLIELAILLAIGGVLWRWRCRTTATGSPMRGSRPKPRRSPRRSTARAARRSAAAQRVTVCKSADRRPALPRAAGTRAGWSSSTRTGTARATPTRRRCTSRHRRRSPVTIAANRPLADYVSYTSVGHPRLINGGLQMGTFVACSPGRRAIKVMLAHSGRVRLEKTGQTCP